MYPAMRRDTARWVGIFAALSLLGCAESSVVGVQPDPGNGPNGIDVPSPSCAAGQIECVGSVARTCDGSGAYTETIDCAPSGNQCVPGYGCVACVPYSPTGCEAGVGTMCNAAGTGYVDFECDALQGMECNPSGCTGACSPSELGPSYIGCEYWPTVTWNGVLEEWFDFAAAVANASGVVAHVTITKGDQPIKTAEIAPNSLEIITLPWVLDLKGVESGSGVLVSLPTDSVRSNQGAYRLRSDAPVTVYQFNALQYKNDSAPTASVCENTHVCCPDAFGDGGCFSFSNDASLLLPTTALTPNYSVGGYRAASYLLSAMFDFVAITATEDGTEIDVRPTSTTDQGGGLTALGPGEVGSFTLNRGDVVELLSTGVSLSGSTIWSPNEKPFQLLSGVPAVNIPDIVKATDHIEEIVLPSEALGRDYIVSVPTTPLGKRIMTVRIQPSRSPVELHFDPPDLYPVTSVQPYEALEIAGVQADFRVFGDGPFTVSQFMHGGGLGPQEENAAGAGDPSQGLAVPTAQFRDEYVFLAPNDYDVNYVNIIAPSDATVVLDGVAISDDEYEPVGKSNHRVARHVLDDKQFHIVKSDKPFGITVYGYGSYTSYMYPGGLDVKRFSAPPIK
jgi:hypothetical protein